jgi:hypothetical protein
VLLEAARIEMGAELEYQPLAAADPQPGEEVDDSPRGHPRTVPPQGERTAAPVALGGSEGAGTASRRFCPEVYRNLLAILA